MELEQLLDFAATRDIEIAFHSPSFSCQKGLWLPKFNTISLLTGMGEINTRCTLAHELGHWAKGHCGCGGKEELQADRWAASYLISGLEFRMAAELHDGHPGAIAEALGVTRHLVEVYWQMCQCKGFQALAS